MMRIISYEDIRQLEISPKECYRWVCEAMDNKEKVLLPPKISMQMPEKVFCNVMPCVLPTELEDAGGLKVVTRYPTREPSLDSKILLFDAQSGEFEALMDANWITAMRTGAVAAHSIKLLAKKDFSTIGMMGLGNTARATLAVLSAMEPKREMYIKLLKYKGQEELFAKRFKGKANLHFTYVESAEEIVKGSEVVISATTYLEADICRDDCYEEGVLVVPICSWGFMNCDLFFDRVYADDYGHIKGFKNFDKFKYFAEIGDVVNEQALGRQSDKERILVYNIGLSMYDINFARHIYQMTREVGGAQEIDLCDPRDKFFI